MNVPAFARLQFLLVAGAAVATLPAMAQGQGHEALYVRSLAATCANCHGTNGSATKGSQVPSVAGMPKEYMLRQLTAFKDGSRPASVMHQIAKGFSDAQLDQIATYFAGLKQ
ncbi:c-type cytochrome [Ramlibacter sp. RBP-2]|uniref:C-type cytochrome n=1 Tax=Ramlibacter lithotrophicus TaxID=2606681 RepID=A0A7X6DIK6_9BURK|nr:c-type cytochrome [Ramlibacter lithotrophicus]NKE67842.1 c-type cytochrome [Ramlibacter lithotrophicus]